MTNLFLTFWEGRRSMGAARKVLSDAPQSHPVPPAPPPVAPDVAGGSAESLAVQALAVTDRDAAALMGISRAHWHVLVRDGRAPAPVKLARATRWRRLELIAWLN